jgi:hypothetical protein
MIVAITRISTIENPLCLRAFKLAFVFCLGIIMVQIDFCGGPTTVAALRARVVPRKFLSKNAKNTRRDKSVVLTELQSGWCKLISLTGG